MAVVLLSEKEPFAVAHRGAPDFAPENTLSSFTTAVKQGADAIECGIWLSADGKLVVNHDYTTGRIWSEDLEIEKTDSEKLLSLSLGNGFCAAFPKCRNEHIPLFSEVIRNTGDTHIFAELKSETPKAENALLFELGKYDMKERVTVISFSRETVDFFLSKGYKCAWLVKCTSDEVSSLEIPAGAMLDVNADALNEQNVKELHEKGITVYAWTASGETAYEHLRALGVDGITCDNIAFLHK